MTGRRRAALVIGTSVAYVAAIIVMMVPIALVLEDRGMPVPLSYLLGIVLAHIALAALTIPLRIYAGFRERSHRDRRPD